MKAVLTMTMMLGLLITFADAHPLGEKRSGGVITEQKEKNFKLCTQNLVAIGKAVETYKKEHGNFPDWLSNLHPKYFCQMPTSSFVQQTSWVASQFLHATQTRRCP